MLSYVVILLVSTFLFFTIFNGIFVLSAIAGVVVSALLFIFVLALPVSTRQMNEMYIDGDDSCAYSKLLLIGRTSVYLHWNYIVANKCLIFIRVFRVSIMAAGDHDTID